MVEPILKWAGGKRSLISNIVGLFPSDYPRRRYHEPFLGAGAVFFNICPESGSINDVNPRLINFYKVVRDKPDELISLAKRYRSEEESFYSLRDRFNQPGLSDVEDASLLLFLNKTAFNGLYRVNSKGEFNVPFGGYKNPKIVPENRIHKASRILKKVEIMNTDFSYIVDYAKNGDLCYFDPPYVPVSDTASFTSYSTNGFSWQDQERLRDTCIELEKKGILYVLSNSYTQELENIYKDLEFIRIEIVMAKRAISSKASTRGPIKEILISNIPQKISIKNKLKLTNYIST